MEDSMVQAPQKLLPLLLNLHFSPDICWIILEVWQHLYNLYGIDDWEDLGFALDLGPHGFTARAKLHLKNKLTDLVDMGADTTSQPFRIRVHAYAVGIHAHQVAYDSWAKGTPISTFEGMADHQSTGL